MKGFHLIYGTLAVVVSIMLLVESAEDYWRKLAQANNEYGINLHKQLTNLSSENLFFSPLSLSAAMAMLYAGAKGETADELRHILGYETAHLEENQVHSAFHKFLTDTLQNKHSKPYVLNSANSVLVDKKFEVLTDYKDKMQRIYDAVIRVFDFQSEEQKVVREVNDFVKTRTSGKISKLLNELPSDASLLILNAVYFKGTWKTKFDIKETNLQTFYNEGSDFNAKKVQMMNLKSELPYAETSDSEALELSYKGENISMLILLPISRDGLSALESSLTLEKLLDIQKEMQKTTTMVSLPKFKLEFSREMSEDMKDMGAKKIFSDKADLSGITISSKVFVSQIVHKAVVEVNEEGSEAAAATRIGYARSIGGYQMFIADHPFLFFIMDKRNGMILFSGRVNTL